MADSDLNVVGALALYAAQEIARAVEAETQLNGVAASALVTIGHAPGESIDFLARVLRRSHSAVVRLVGGLVDRGLVARSGGEDARVVQLSLTRSGKQLVRRALSRRTGALEALLEPLDASERTALAGIAHKLIVAHAGDELNAYWICRLCDGDACDPCPMSEVFDD
jgi:MarR family transcriptional repressor of emrRAB